MSNGTLKHLSKALGLAEGYLKGIAKGNKRGRQDFLTMNTANACRAVAFFTGYPNKERARKAIRNNVSQLYTSSIKVANSILKVADKYGEEKREILKKAAEALKSDNFQEFNRLIKSNKELSGFQRKCSKSINKKLIETFRNSPKTNGTTAKKLLLAQKSPNGYKIVAPKSKIDKEVERRLKRFGAVASLFW